MTENMEKTKAKYLIEGPVTPQRVADMVAKHQPKTDCGAHTIFLGQVRADEEGGKKVVAIDYSAYEEMADKAIAAIREEAFAKWQLRCLHIYHSLGEVKVGECSLMVMVSSAHRQPSFPSLEYIVEEVKKRVPVWKKEIFEDGSHRWIDGEPNI